MEIPVHFVGVSKGVKNGGVLRRNQRKLRIKALPGNLPDYIEADITPLKIGSKLYVTDFENDLFTIMHPDNTVVCQVRTARAAIVDEIDEEEEEEGVEGEEAATEEGGTEASGGDTPAAETAKE